MFLMGEDPQLFRVWPDTGVTQLYLGQDFSRVWPGKILGYRNVGRGPTRSWGVFF